MGAIDFNPDSWNEYLDKINPYFRYCSESSVLEIGPYEGWHTDIILSYIPRSLVVVEPNPYAVGYLRIKHPKLSIIREDIFKYVENSFHFDVVICCGVLYHFHSPIYLLEQIANNFTPTHIVIESIFDSIDDDKCLFHNEPDNEEGARFTNKLSSKISITFSKTLLIKIMQNMEYKLIESEDMSFEKVLSKENISVLVFEKV